MLYDTSYNIFQRGDLRTSTIRFKHLHKCQHLVKMCSLRFMTSVITDIFFDRGQSWPIRIQFILFFIYLCLLGKKILSYKFCLDNFTRWWD